MADATLLDFARANDSAAGTTKKLAKQAALAGYAGLLISYYASVPSGPVIIVCAGVLYAASLLFAPRGWLPRLLRRPHLQA